ncbi:cation:proton antiporter domain-containing protein [Mobilicoccus pelagius]|nr:cation:proton antiporter [Mobilicoccus pelagius]
METAATILAVTFALGYLALLLRLPPLVGFLAAGFALGGLGVQAEEIHTLADLGVTLLLFAIGLKLDVRTLLAKEVWVTTVVTCVAGTLTGMAWLWCLGVMGFTLLQGAGVGALTTVALGLVFSSTVFVMKLIEERGDEHAFYARIAIGVLVVQDVIAVVFLTATTGHLPSPWAFALVLLWPAVRLFRSVWGRLGHGEMQSLFGILMALVPGYLLFESVGLKGDLGALVVGAMLASHPSASELSRSLFHVKELLLVGFFLSIGMFGGLPTAGEIGLAALLLLILPVHALGYVLVLRAMRVRHRTGWLVAFALMQFSEFGLIVAAIGADSGILDQRWVVVLSLAVSFAFVLSSFVNGIGQPLVERLAGRMPAQDPSRLHPEDRPADVSGAEALVVGLGRVGRSAFTQLTDTYGLHVVGIDSDHGRVRKLTAAGLQVVETDASDEEFFSRLTGRERVRMVVLALPAHNAEAVAILRASGFGGVIATAVRYEEGVARSLSAGADAAFNAASGAGLELADQVARLDSGAPATGPMPAVRPPDAS